MKKTVFTGSGVAVVTPMHADYSVNYEEYGKILDFLVDNGSDAIIACGTTGEASTLGDEEHIDVIAYAVERVGNRVPVVAGTGSNDTSYAIEMTKEAEKAGAAATLQVTPYYNKTSQRGLIAHFTAIADATSLPVIIYNVPSRTGMNVTPETYLELSRHERIVATKEASGNLTAIATAIALCGDELDVYSGNDQEITPIMALGGKGVISVLANVKPKETAELCRLCLENDFIAAARLQVGLIPLINALFSDVNPIPVKEAMKLIGFDAGPCRLPLYELSDGGKADLARLLG